jgi:hypothetical protein
MLEEKGINSAWDARFFTAGKTFFGTSIISDLGLESAALG